MVRSLAQWTKTLSFPARISPNKTSKESVNIHQVSPAITPTLSNNSLTKNNDFNNIMNNNHSSQTEVNQIYSDPESEKAIMSSVVYCIHHKEGCKWSDELRKLKGHLNTCKHDAIPCTSKCGAQIPRVLMEDHLKYTCPQRRTRCEFCNKEFTGHTLENHVGNCGYEPLYCENKCGVKVQRRHHSQHKVGDCSKRLLSCRYCTKEFVADTLAAHHVKCGRVPIQCPNRCDINVLAREELETHIKEECTVSVHSCSFKEAGCRFKGPRYVMEKHLEENCQQHLTLMCNVVSKQQHQISSLKSALSRLSLNYSGTLIWKISDFSGKMSEAKNKEGMELVSPPFYTSQYGYKLQASLFPNGNGAGEGSHISVYIKILPGEYDALLRWPFSHSVSFTLFDQSTCPEKACNIVESFIPDPTWKNFQRPSLEPDSLGFGFPKFVSHEMLKKRHFMKDDTMFIRVKVDPSKIVAV
ncbi:TNF receptor associated factor 4 isoform X1 [Leptinotarsa decemlineata]|uniref:TNF receptor associated factor 4 isoform X1 n=2 Tax=Leptinotarsa decemlineata TaxID=7539 RepID=UPI000C251946|nr:TNF receptor-associated factor 4 isoform X1 [Leptinotarsa decemlineata]